MTSVLYQQFLIPIIFFLLAALSSNEETNEKKLK